MGVEDDGGVEHDLALVRRAAELLVVLQGGLAGGEEEIPALVVRRHHVQGARLGIVQGKAVVLRQNLLYFRVFQQTDLFAPYIAPEGRGRHRGLLPGIPSGLFRLHRFPGIRRVAAQKHIG